jgi:hypothetical protein
MDEDKFVAFYEDYLRSHQQDCNLNEAAPRGLEGFVRLQDYIEKNGFEGSAPTLSEAQVAVTIDFCREF